MTTLKCYCETFYANNLSTLHNKIVQPLYPKQIIITFKSPLSIKIGCPQQDEALAWSFFVFIFFPRSKQVDTEPKQLAEAVDRSILCSPLQQLQRSTGSAASKNLWSAATLEKSKT